MVQDLKINSVQWGKDAFGTQNCIIEYPNWDWYNNTRYASQEDAKIKKVSNGYIVEKAGVQFVAKDLADVVEILKEHLK